MNRPSASERTRCVDWPTREKASNTPRPIPSHGSSAAHMPLWVCLTRPSRPVAGPGRRTGRPAPARAEAPKQSGGEECATHPGSVPRTHANYSRTSRRATCSCRRHQGPPEGGPSSFRCPDREPALEPPEVEPPGTAPVRRGVQDPRRRDDRQTRDLDHRQAGAAAVHDVAPVGELRDAEVGRRVEIARQIVAHNVGDREVGQVEAAIDPRRRPLRSRSPRRRARAVAGVLTL